MRHFIVFTLLTCAAITTFAQTQSLQNPVCQSDFVQEAMELGRLGASDAFQLRQILMKGSRNKHTHSNRIRYMGAAALNPLSVAGRSMAMNDFSLKERIANTLVNVWLTPITQATSMYVQLTDEKKLGSVSPRGLEDIANKVSRIKVSPHTVYDLNDFIKTIGIQNRVADNSTKPYIYGDSTVTNSPLAQYINSELNEIDNLLILDQELEQLRVDYIFGEPKRNDYFDHNQIQIDRNNAERAILAKRSEVNYAIGVRYHRMHQYILNRGHCRRNTNTQDRLQQEYKLPAETFYPDAEINGNEEEVLMDDGEFFDESDL